MRIEEEDKELGDSVPESHRHHLRMKKVQVDGEYEGGAAKTPEKVKSSKSVNPILSPEELLSLKKEVNKKTKSEQHIEET